MMLPKLHMIFCLLSGIGIVFLIIWAAQTLKAKKIKKIGIWFIIIGIVGIVLLGGCKDGKFGKFGKFGIHKNGTTYNQAMIQAMSNRGMDMTEEELEEMMVEMKDMMKKRVEVEDTE